MKLASSPPKSSPSPRTTRSRTPENPSAPRPFVTLRLRTDDGIEGLGVTFYGGALTAACGARSTSLARSRSARTRCGVEASSPKLRAAAGGSGPGGIFTLALVGDRHRAVGHPRQGARPAAVEAARRLARHACRPMPAARCGAACRSTTLVTAAARAGGKGLARDEDAAGAARRSPRPPARSSACAPVREAIGPDIHLMCDINQRWRPEQAIDIGRRVEDAGRPVLARGRDRRTTTTPGIARVDRGAGDAGLRRRISSTASCRSAT